MKPPEPNGYLSGGAKMLIGIAVQIFVNGSGLTVRVQANPAKTGWFYDEPDINASLRDSSQARR
ncbi:MAG: hypothetical protein K8F25_02160 [Fimbriimonadaceae bacterium]|nr:hypothetical protein [Alphaproteobacteria bacterium]